MKGKEWQWLFTDSDDVPASGKEVSGLGAVRIELLLMPEAAVVLDGQPLNSMTANDVRSPDCVVGKSRVK
jgi:hypothetical protein